MTARDDRRGARTVRGPRPAAERLPATAFVLRLKAGLVADPRRAELAGGALAWVPPAAWQEAEVLARLAASLDKVSGQALALAEAPLLRVGPADLWRPRLALLGPGRGRPAPGPGATLEAAGALLVVESGHPAPDLAERLAGYAAAGVREAWVLDLREGWTVAYRSPWGGAYASRTLWYPGEGVPVGALPGRSVATLERGFRPLRSRGGGRG